MTAYETISSLIATVALIISLVVWHGQRALSKAGARLQQEANEISRATARLAEKQLELLVKEEAASPTKTGRLSMRLFKDGSTYRFELTNLGQADARNIRLATLGDAESPILDDDYDSKFPVPRLQPGESVRLIALIYLSSPTAFNFLASWTEDDGTERCDELFVAL